MIQKLTESQLETLTIVNMAASALSLVGSSFIIFCYWYFKNLRRFAFKLVFILACSDAAYEIANLLGDPADGSGLCYVQAVLVSYFGLTSVLWSGVIAYTVYETVISQNGHVSVRIKAFHIFVWTTAFILTALPFTTNSYGSAGSWCWISNDQGNISVTWRLVQFYIPLWITFAFNTTVYIRIVQVMRSLFGRQQSMLESRQKEMKVLRRLRLYPLVLVVCWISGTVNRIQNFIAPDHPIFVLYLLHILFGSLQGFFNSLVYGFTASVKTAISEAFQRCCGMCGIFLQRVEQSKALLTEGEGKGKMKALPSIPPAKI
eukprot:GILK01003926.1.p1 GENE.GILK01003926.1~~GILK01003926.1.p1  ORF type:complete len:317 (-),score=26.39 GILK01003926.1:333-1283(-)